jgi:hypothetical protein
MLGIYSYPFYVWDMREIDLASSFEMVGKNILFSGTSYRHILTVPTKHDNREMPNMATTCLGFHFDKWIILHEEYTSGKGRLFNKIVINVLFVLFFDRELLLYPFLKSKQGTITLYLHAQLAAATLCPRFCLVNMRDKNKKHWWDLLSLSRTSMIQNMVAPLCFMSVDEKNSIKDLHPCVLQIY